MGRTRCEHHPHHVGVAPAHLHVTVQVLGHGQRLGVQRLIGPQIAEAGPIDVVGKVALVLRWIPGQAYAAGRGVAGQIAWGWHHGEGHDVGRHGKHRRPILGVTQSHGVTQGPAQTGIFHGRDRVVVEVDPFVRRQGPAGRRTGHDNSASPEGAGIRRWVDPRRVGHPNQFRVGELLARLLSARIGHRDADLHRVSELARRDRARWQGPPGQRRLWRAFLAATGGDEDQQSQTAAQSGREASQGTLRVRAHSGTDRRRRRLRRAAPSRRPHRSRRAPLRARNLRRKPHRAGAPSRCAAVARRCSRCAD